MGCLLTSRQSDGLGGVISTPRFAPSGTRAVNKLSVELVRMPGQGRLSSACFFIVIGDLPVSCACLSLQVQKSVHGNYLFRSMGSVIWPNKFPAIIVIAIAQGTAIASQIGEGANRNAPKRPEISKFPVTFPVLREIFPCSRGFASSIRKRRR